MATLFISDLHLSPERPAIAGLFQAFVRERAVQAQALYILGDLFEAWIGDDAAQPGDLPVLEALRDLAAAGVPVFVMHGNRDFLLGQGFAARTGCTLLAEPAVIDLHGTRTLLMHGDTLCTDDVDYQRLRAMVRDPAWQADLLAKTPAERLALAQRLRQVSREATGGKAEYIMDVNPDAVVKTMREHGVTQLIHGHTHRPAIHELEVDGRPARRIVLGDWYENGSVLVCNRHGCRLEGL